MFLHRPLLLLLLATVRRCCTHGYLDADDVRSGIESASMLSFSQYVNGSHECQVAVSAFHEDYAKDELWAIKMVDAAGKPASGIMDGYLSWLGSYSECVGLENVLGSQQKFQVNGKYCTVKNNSFNVTNPSNLTSAVIDRLTELNKEVMGMLSLKIGICIPSSCKPSDIEEAIKLSTNGSFTAQVTCEQEKKFSFDAGSIAVISLCLLLIGLALLGTLLDYWYVQGGEINDKVVTSANTGKCFKFFFCFSLISNLKKILNIDINKKKTLGSLHGLRFVSICWVVLGHTYGFLPISVIGGVLKAKKETFANPWFDAIISGDFSVDTFLLLSGLLVTYVVLNHLCRQGGKFNIIVFYFHRWWRLTPVYMMVLAITTVFIPPLIAGPLAGENLAKLGDCPSNWWTNILYINNFVNIDKMCFSHSWYLACDMQMYLVSPLILYPLAKKPILGLIINTVFMLLSMIIPAALTAVNDYPPTATIGSDPKTVAFFQNIYIKPYCRMVPYCIGIYIGYFLHRNERKLRINKICLIVGWVVSTTLALLLIYGKDILLNGSQAVPSTEFSALYAGLSKLVWSLVVAWVVIITTTGNAPWVDGLLSNKYLVPPSRLTYCIYLIHPPLLYLNSGIVDHSMSFSHYYVIKLFIAILVITLAASLLSSALFESPFLGLENLILRRPKKKLDTKRNDSEAGGHDNKSFETDVERA